MDCHLVEDAVAPHADSSVTDGYRRSRGRKLASDTSDGLNRYPSDRLYLRRHIISQHQGLEAHMLHALFVGPVLEAEGMSGHKILVVQLLIDDDISYTQG